MRVINECRLDFQYKLSPEGTIITNTIYSNKTLTEVLLRRIKIEKYVNKERASIFEVLTYTIVISNISEFDVKDVYFKDCIPKGTAFINNTVFINDIKKRCLNPNKGFEIGTINKNEKKYISFKVVILQSSCKKITNYSNSIYSYVYNTEKPPIRLKIKSNKVNTLINDNLFKQINIENKVILDCKFPMVEKIKKIKIRVSTIKTKVVASPIVCNKRYKDLQVYNLIIIGKIEYVIEYSYKVCDCNNRCIKFKNKTITIIRGFSSNILVPNGIKYLKKQYVKYNIENVSCKILNRRCLFLNADMFIKL